MPDLTPIGYIIDQSQKCIGKRSIQFKYINGITNNVEARYEDISIPGRSEPIPQYDSTGYDIYPITIQLATAEEEGFRTTAEDTWSDYLFIKSFQYPEYGPTWRIARKPPHLALLSIGNKFLQVGQIRGVNGDWSESPIDENGRPHIIKVTFNFYVLHEEPLSYEQVKAGY